MRRRVGEHGSTRDLRGGLAYLLCPRLGGELLQLAPLFLPPFRNPRKLLLGLLFCRRRGKRKLDDLLVDAHLRGVFQYSQKAGIVDGEFTEILE